MPCGDVVGIQQLFAFAPTPEDRAARAARILQNRCNRRALSVEVENAVAKHPAVAQVAVIGIPTTTGTNACTRWSSWRPDRPRPRRTSASSSRSAGAITCLG
ncbi:hypothetical protein [Nocardia sp. NPDC060249]|uniref:AMP-binding enzyme n=1 Tax=Nocardia sp. NPDC060249 TaxID=3347082 RepID=UPI003659A368